LTEQHADPFHPFRISGQGLCLRLLTKKNQRELLFTTLFYIHDVLEQDIKRLFYHQN